MQPEIIFLIAFLSGLVGNECSHRIKAINRSLYAKLAVGFLAGFASGLIVLILQSRFQTYPVPVAIVIGCAYGFFMANSKVFNKVR